MRYYRMRTGRETLGGDEGVDRECAVLARGGVDDRSDAQKRWAERGESGDILEGIRRRMIGADSRLDVGERATGEEETPHANVVRHI